MIESLNRVTSSAYESALQRRNEDAPGTRPPQTENLWHELSDPLDRQLRDRATGDVLDKKLSRDDQLALVRRLARNLLTHVWEPNEAPFNVVGRGSQADLDVHRTIEGLILQARRFGLADTATKLSTWLDDAGVRGHRIANDFEHPVRLSPAEQASDSEHEKIANAWRAIKDTQPEALGRALEAGGGIRDAATRYRVMRDVLDDYPEESRLRPLLKYQSLIPYEDRRISMIFELLPSLARTGSDDFAIKLFRDTSKRIAQLDGKDASWIRQLRWNELATRLAEAHSKSKAPGIYRAFVNDEFIPALITDYARRSQGDAGPDARRQATRMSSENDPYGTGSQGPLGPAFRSLFLSKLVEKPDDALARIWGWESTLKELAAYLLSRVDLCEAYFASGTKPDVPGVVSAPAPEMQATSPER